MARAWWICPHGEVNACLSFSCHHGFVAYHGTNTYTWDARNHLSAISGAAPGLLWTPSFHLRSVLPANANGRCADRAFEGPATNMIDLFLHRLRQRPPLGGSLEEILLGELLLLQPRLGQRRNHRLLDLGAGPAFHVSRQAFQVEVAGIDVPAAEVNL